MILDDETNDSSEFDWIINKEKIIQNYKGYIKEQQKNITITSIFVNNDNCVDKIEYSTVSTINNNSTNGYTIIPYNIIIQSLNYITNKTKKKYNSPTILLYIVDLTHEQINWFNFLKQKETEYLFLKEIKKYNDIHIPDSIFIFHPINTIYIIYQEIHTNLISTLIPQRPLRIVDEYIKPSQSQSLPHRKTKKVSFNIPTKPIPNHIHNPNHNFKHTKKIKNI